MARRWAVLLCAVPPVLAALTGCTPRLPPSPVASAAPTGSSAPAAPTVVPRPTPATLPALPLPATPGSAAGFPADSAVACAGKPGADRVVSLLRARRIVEDTATPTARLGPLCAGTWQYTVLSVPGREPLQVVTQGPPTGLVLVTAGTDVCTPEVRVQAPPGIVAAAHCQ
jgi:hypothetical protein